MSSTTLRERYCRLLWDRQYRFDEWMQWRDWASIDFTEEEISEIEQEAEQLGITLAPCFDYRWYEGEPYGIQ